MQKLQLYIGTERLDLFKDETVSLTQTIQNVRDIAKIFTEFTKTFSLPASPVNNRIFKHYYNFDILNGFDARNKVAGSLELNTIPYKTGFISLQGVDLKNNSPHTYKITFFGNTVNLKDILGDQQLSVLGTLASLNTVYSYDNIKSALQVDPTNSNVNLIVPLITHTNRMTYTGLTSLGENGNVFWNGFANTPNGIQWNQFKFAIKLQYIIDGIEAQFPEITFSSSFFNNSSNSAFNNLFMWLHRKKGSVDAAGQVSTPWTELNDLVFQGSGTPSGSGTINGYLLLDNFTNYTNTKLTITPTTTNIAYDVRILRNSEVYEERLGLTTAVVFFATGSTLSPGPLQGGSYTIQVRSTQTISFNANGFAWLVNNLQPGQQFQDEYKNANSFSSSSDQQFIISNQIPEMTILNFLTNIFQMFNLTAYVESDGTIEVKTLDSYYAEASTTPTNIDSYLDVTKSSVNIALPFKQIQFMYKGLGTFLAKQYEQLNNSGWGSLNYSTSGGEFSTPSDVYKVQIGFEHLLYERLYDQRPAANLAPTTIQYGYFVDSNQESYYGLPLIFYAIKQTSATNIAFRKYDSTNNTETVGLNNYIIPSNSKTLTPLSSTTNINFRDEVNEYTGESGFTGTLFQNKYSNYIIDVFNQQRRLTKVTAYLPLKIFFDLQLNQIIQIGQDNYRINSVTTNLTNGKSEFELLNVINLLYNSITATYFGTSYTMYFTASITTVENLTVGDALFDNIQMTIKAGAGTYYQEGSTSPNTHCEDSSYVMAMVLDTNGIITSISCGQP
tara:strand:- start:1870 stop:4218 length:2349 start_codon:yes stop_codon:yes gene_type:complete